MRETTDAVVHAEPVMGTVVSFLLYRGGLSEAKARSAIDRACRRLHELDAVFSTWSPTSPMSRLRSGEIGLKDVPGEIPLVLDICERAKQLSQGWFDPWAMPGGLDPTGLVKGWAIAEALAIVQRAGVDTATVNGGGDIAVLGTPPGGDAWRVGIQHPWRPGALACVLETTVAVATSGCYERGCHLIDPRDCSRPALVASATVTGGDLAFVDALATALAVAGDEVLSLISSLDGYEAYLIRADGSEEATAGIVLA